MRFCADWSTSCSHTPRKRRLRLQRGLGGGDTATHGGPVRLCAEDMRNPSNPEGRPTPGVRRRREASGVTTAMVAEAAHAVDAHLGNGVTVPELCEFIERQEKWRDGLNRNKKLVYNTGSQMALCRF